MLRRMPWLRRGARDVEQPEGRLPDLEFLALVQASLEAHAPGVTRGFELKGNSLISPSGWVIAVTAPHHGGANHYDLAALPDVSIQPDVPLFLDCVVATAGNHRVAADSWVQTTGACLLELLDRRERFADHAGPEHERGVPGWHMIASGATGVGLDTYENRRLQRALVDANVLHRIADTFTADLESPLFNGVKVFYGGKPGSVRAEIRINGERHDAASAAMAALPLPEPTVFTAVRYYALLLPMPADGGKPIYPGVRLHLEDADGHAHSATCGCGGQLDPEHPGFDLTLPHLLAELSPDERSRRIRVDTGAMMIADGVGNFLKARLPIQLEDGRTVIYLAWIYVDAPVIEEYVRRVHDKTLEGHRFPGMLCNAIGPWGEDVLRAPVVVGGQRFDEDGSIRTCEIVKTRHKLLNDVLRKRWPAEVVLGDRDPRLR
jgi:hypothetical protein